MRPAVDEVTHGETVAEMIRMAGGFSADAALRRVTVHRILPAAERGPGPFPQAAIDVPLEIREGAVVVPQLTLDDGDSVIVDSVPGLNGPLCGSIAGMGE